MALTDTGLLCRYWFDEAASGTSITNINDSGPAGYDLDSVSYSTTLGWTEVGGNRGIASSANSGTAVIKGPTFASNAAMLAGINGIKKMTVEMVVDLDSASVGGRLMSVCQNTSYGQQLGLYGDTAGKVSWAWAGNVVSSVSLSGRSVIHLVFDTTLSAERMKFYVNNVKIFGTNLSIALDSAPSVDTSYVLAFFNRPNDLVAAPQAALFYAAIYSDVAFDTARLSDHYDALIVDDDAPVGDTTAPTLTSASASATSATTSSGSVTTNEANGTLYWLTNTSSTATVAAVKAGSSQTVTATGAQSTSSTGLSTGTTYYTHFVHTDVAANDSTVLSSASFTTPAPDTTAPVLSGQTATAKTSSTIEAKVTTDEGNGTMYVVATQSATPPSRLQIRNGQDENGATADFATSFAVSSVGEKTTTVTGLTALTTYYIYSHQQDAAHNNSNRVVASATTFRAGASAGSIVTATGPTGGNPAGFLYALAQTLPTSDWVSYYIVSGPTPSGGTLDAQANGAFSYFGPEPATLVIQPEVNGVEGDQIIVTLYDQTVAPPEPDTGITQFAPFPTKAGKVQLSTASVSASDVYLNRLRYLTDGSAIRAVAASPDLFSSGIPMSSTGQVCYIDATAGLPAGTVWANGMPFSAGRLCVSTGTVASYQNGIPFAANGAVAVELI